jgi:benzoyl-CoA reductase subunit C
VELSGLIARAEELYFDLALAEVARWKERTRKRAIGYLPIYVPRELIDAAGMLPVGLMGGRGQVEIIRGDAYFQSYICQIPRSTIELALSGKLDHLDGFLFPSICDVIRNLSGMWKLAFPDKYVRYVDVPQNYVAGIGGRFYQAELERLRLELAALAETRVTDEDLRRSIVRYNDNRRAIAELMAVRKEKPWIVPAKESYLVLFAGTVMPVEEHTRFVRDYLALAERSDRKRRDQVKVAMVGSFCEQPPLDLIHTLEVAGCYVVWDDMSLGRRWIEGDIDAAGDPIRALSDAFLSQSVSTASRYEPIDKGAAIRRMVKESGAEGVVFAAPSFCDPALLDQPMLQASLDAAGIPWTAFKYSEGLGQFQVIREQAGTFADSIKLWGEA